MKGESDEVTESDDKSPCGRRCCDSSLSTEISHISQVPKEINIVVDSIESVDPNKVKEISIKIEFAEEVLADSEPIPIERSYTEMTFSTTIKVGEITPQFIDDVLANPVIFTIFDCSTIPITTSPVAQREEKETRKRKGSFSSNSSKTLPSPVQQEKIYQKIGICNLDIGELVLGKKNTIKDTLFLESDKKLQAHEKKSWTKLPKIGVCACVGCDFLPEPMQKTVNAVGVTVEHVFNPPSHFKEGSLFKARLPIPKYGDTQNYLTFPNGVLKTRDSDGRRKWLNLAFLDGTGGRSKIVTSADVSDVYNTLPPKSCLERQMLTHKPVIEWNTWRNCVLVKADTTHIYSKILKHRVWPIEVMLANKSTPQKATKTDKKGKALTVVPAPSVQSPVQEVQDHFVAFLDLSALLYPGVKTTRVAAQLYTYSSLDLKNKFGMDVDPVPSASVNGRNRPSTVMSKGSVKEMEDRDSKDTKEIKDIPGEAVFNEDGNPTFIVVDVDLHKPFVQKKEPEFLQEQLNNYACIKQKLFSKDTNVAMASRNYANTLLQMTSSLTQEYQKFCNSCKVNEQEIDDLEKEFLDYLYRQDKIKKIRSSLEEDIYLLIKEKYGAIDYAERIPEIYINLVDEMHRVTNTSMTEYKTMPKYSPNLKNLQLFAEEAYEENDFQLAKEYLTLKITQEPSNPIYWLDYAVYLIKRNESEAAIEATREALSIDPNHFMGLLIYGLLMTRIQNLKIAELALQVLLSKYPNFVEGWVCLRMLYQALYNTEGEVVAGQTAKKLEFFQRNAELGQMKSVEKKLECLGIDGKKECPMDHTQPPTETKGTECIFNSERLLSEPLSWTLTLCPPDNAYLRAATLLLKLGVYEYASLALSLAQTNHDCKHSPYEEYYVAVNLYNQQKYVESICILDNYARRYGKDPFVWSLMGHCYYKLGRDEKAIPCYEYVMECYNRPEDIHLIYLRMGYYFMKVNKFPCSKQVFLTACKYSPTPKLWKGIGMSCLGLCEVDDAEIAFTEANYLDNRDPETWGYLALTNILMNRELMFHHCYAEAKKRKLSNMKLIEEIEVSASLSLMGLEY